MDFVAFDVETANSDLASICQVGFVWFKDGQIADTWQSLVDPEDYFDGMNISIHGIDEQNVAGAPTFPEIAAVVARHLSETVVVAHTAFDRASIRAVCDKYSIATPQSTWLDTAKVVRRTWSDLANRGYGLANVAERLSIQFQHHNAVEDARAAGEILLHAILETGHSVVDWLERVKRPIHPSQSGSSERITRDGNPEGPLFGEVAAFTGALSLLRREAADLAAAAGCEVIASVTKATTLLVVGDQDVKKLAGHEKSKNHRKAEKLAGKGQPIRILRESDFLALVGQAK